MAKPAVDFVLSFFILGVPPLALVALGKDMPWLAAIGVRLSVVLLGGERHPKLRNSNTPRRLWGTTAHPSRGVRSVRTFLITVTVW